MKDDRLEVQQERLREAWRRLGEIRDYCDERDREKQLEKKLKKPTPESEARRAE